MNALENIQAVVLAAGKSTRFKTRKSKLLFSICGRAMIMYPLKVLESLSIPMTLVLGYQKELVWSEVERNETKKTSYVVQDEQLGTGHAVQQTQLLWEKDNILILSGDTPLITKEVIASLVELHKSSDVAISFLTTQVIDPTGYGRIVEDNGHIAIVEEKNCTPEQRLITRVNSGIYVIKRAFLEQYLNRLEKNSVTEEIYVVDLVKIASETGAGVKAKSVPFDSVRGVNTLQELWSVEQIKRSLLA